MKAAPASDSWAKPLRSASIVSVGKGAQALMSLAFVSLAARTLGMEAFGLLSLVHGLVFGLSQIIRFQTWQAVVRFGAQALEADDPARLQRLLRFTTGLDAAAAIVGFSIIAFAIGPAGEWLSVPGEFHGVVRWYGLSIITMVMAATPLGVLRLLDRFDLISLQTTIAPAIRLLGTLMLFFSGGDLMDFLVVWFVAAVASRIVLLGMAWSQLRQRGLLRHFWRLPDRDPEVGIWRFILSLNLSRGLFVSQPQIGLLLAGGLLGPAAAGVFRIAQQFSDVLIKPATKLLVPAIYPELAKLQSEQNHDQRRSMVLRMSLLVGGIAASVLIVLVVFGEVMITSFVGAEYAPAYTPMLWLALGGLISVIAFPLEPLLSSTGRTRQIVFAQLLATVLYLTLALILVNAHGLSGVAMATLGAVLGSTTVLALSGRDLILQRRR